MKFSIVTPAFNQPAWLRLCAASVADQPGVEAEHLVQEGGGAETQQAIAAWADRFPRLRLWAEPDAGMYDAINRGLRRAGGEVCAYLNCDEQYLPGALARVAAFFEEHPDADVVFGDALVVDERGHYLCHRQTLLPRLRHTVACHLGTLSCAMFFRRRLLAAGLWFDPAFRVAGDADWVARLLQAGVRMAHVPALLAVFTEAGGNLGLGAGNARELDRLRRRFPAWWTWLAPVWAAAHRWRRWRAGYYRPAPTRYAIYTLAQPERRTEFVVEQPTFLWRGRLTWNR